MERLTSDDSLGNCVPLSHVWVHFSGCEEGALFTLEVLDVEGPVPLFQHMRCLG
jgi:hypothetical protein